MKLSTLFRKSFTSTLILRRWKPRTTDQTLFARKQAKRLKHTNVYDNDETNEKVHELLTPKRIKTLGLLYEKQANTNPQFMKIEPQVKQLIKKNFSEASHYQYYKFRNDQMQSEYFAYAQHKCKIDEQNSTLPKNILKQMQQLQTEPFSLPVALADQQMYLQQYKVFLPDKQYNKKVIQERASRTLQGFVPQ